MLVDFLREDELLPVVGSGDEAGWGWEELSCGFLFTNEKEQ